MECRAYRDHRNCLEISYAPNGHSLHLVHIVCSKDILYIEVDIYMDIVGSFRIHRDEQLEISKDGDFSNLKSCINFTKKMYIRIAKIVL